MESTIEKKFRVVYEPLLENFKKELTDNGIDINNAPNDLPFPFIPESGCYYGEDSYFKFVFVGQDAKNLSRLNEFFSCQDPLKFSPIINYNSSDPEAYPEVIDYTNGNSFWKFVFKFLAMMYNIDDWENFRNEWESEPIKKILGSFVHGNVNSIPKGNFNLDATAKVKNASKIFDKATHIIKAFSPHVILLMNWTAPEEWLSEEIGEPEKIDPNNLWYYYIKDSKTHLYWTYHPSGMRHSTGDEILLSIVKSIKEKRILPLNPEI